METEIAANKAIIRRLFDEALNQRHLELLDELFSADFVDHSTPQQRPGPEGVKDFFVEVHLHFPDIKVTIEDMIAEGNRVVVRTLWHSTARNAVGTSHDEARSSSASAQDSKPFIADSLSEASASAALAAWNSKPLNGSLIQIFHLENGRIVEEWNEGSGLGEA
ncbi:MAG TPA: ester cyclase [Ktedonobacteraceae bacterium]|nr:ester cyclase [Ktedonobacteraceae bacterium]